MALARSTALRNVRTAVGELLEREFDFSPGHLAAVLGGCAFAPSLLTFWLVNGAIDFSTGVLLGTVGGPGGLAVRLVAYLLLVPAFLLLRVAYYLAHPVHRRTVLAGSCPRDRLFSLDWFSVGILATGLPLALRRLGPWLAANAVLLVGVFVLPRLARRERTAVALRLGAIALGAAVFVYASYGDLLAGGVPGVPAPAATLGPAATLTLSDATVATLLRTVNSLALGPVLVALFALGMNRLLTRPELTSLPVVRVALPHRDPWSVVTGSAALGTAFYLLVVAAWTGRLVVVP